MKTFFLKTSKVLLTICLVIFAGLVVWANWEEPPLSQRLNLKPINLSVFNINKTISAEDSASISGQLTAQKGVTACTINRIGSTISVTYHGDETSENVLKSIVEAKNYIAKKVEFDKYDGPQCPVPAEYLDFFTNLKSSLCFR
ncbi:hypothetical protein SAMN04515674_10252 [Pseudarcicella hirudinis]|uniref:HMA domain-containing protein n=1 Tax=Pseudarcicella hirudinis TaxID=1079859 RepID=A0A1I5NPB5_9BACT|nr:hypothetical protein [Pseudarcicella hirudinis]SFP23678.1 hypothetical protein SAMN04515674_10252 [Pseudarcicella hirudinis]